MVSLLRHVDFVRLWAAGTVSNVGDAVTRLALPLSAILVLDASPFEVGVLGAAQFVPFLLIGLPAGAMVDRLTRKRPILVAADLGRALAIGSIPVAYALDGLVLEHLYAAAFVHGCLSVFFDVAVGAYVPALVGRERLVDANAKLELSRSGAQIVGPGVAGALIDLLRAPVALAADAMSFAGSALLLAGIRQREGTAQVSSRRDGASLLREIVEGTRYVARHPYLRAISLTATTANFFRSVLLAVLLVYLARDEGHSAGAIGAALAIGNAGFLVGALIAPSVARHFGVGPTMHAAVAVFGPAALLVALAPSGLALYAVGAMVVVDSFGIVMHGVNQVSLRQAITPEELRGRMTATIRFLIFGAMPLGTMLGGVLGSVVGIRETLWVATAGLFLAALPYTFSSIRRLTAVPGADPEPVEPAPAQPAASEA